MIRTHRTIASAVLALLLGTGISVPAVAGQSVNASIAAQQNPAESTDQLIVKLRDASPANIAGRIDALGRAQGVQLRHLREMSGRSQVVRIPQRVSHAEAHTLARRLERDPTVEFVEPDVRLHPQVTAPQTVPNDTRYGEQWHYYEAAGGINLPAAWYVTTGSSSVVVAVIDSGVLPHAELASRLLPGYDFISDLAVANDGDGRDTNASDPGDYGCNGSTSLWHGTHVAGTIGAASNNGAGVAGVNWTSKILPVRVLGQCGGYTSDIADGIRWASGISIPGVPNNTTPARVENLSLGGSGVCSTTFQNAVNDVVARGTVVVVAAGNTPSGGVDAANTQPANCSGVIAVAATTRTGGKANYSNFGAAVTIAAPGSGVLSTLNTGSTTPGADSYASYNGTSMATPHVAGVVSLMLSLPANAGLTPAQVAAKLKSSARVFPTGTGADCTTTVCGAGIVDAYAALGVVASAPPPAPTPTLNLALASSGGVATASSIDGSGYAASSTNNGDRKGVSWNYGGGWRDGTYRTFPDWLQIEFNGVKSIGEIDVFMVQDNWSNPVEPTETMTFSLYGITDFDVQYWDGAVWQTVPGGSVSGNNRVWRRFAFTPVSTSKIRVYARNSPDGYSRLTEVEAYAPTLNLAMASSGGVATASSIDGSGYAASSTNNGDRKGVSWNYGGGWRDGTYRTFPDWLQIEFNGVKSIGEIDVFMVQDNWSNPVEPTETMTFSLYGITDFDVQYWDGAVWQTVPGGTVIGNNRVWRRFTFTPVSTNGIRVLVRNTPDGYSRLTEVEVYAAP